MNSVNVEFANVEAGQIETILSTDHFDIVILYAVLEHLAPAERIGLLHSIWNHLSDSGLLYIGESPNRIYSFDAHSTELPFVDALPDELYLRYVEMFTSRADWPEFVGRFGDRALGSYRAGRGVSFHEFDIVLGGTGIVRQHVVGDSFAALPRNLYPLRRFETDLLREMRWQGASIDQMFSRFWIEGVLAKSPVYSSDREFTQLSPEFTLCGAIGFDHYGLTAYGLQGAGHCVSFNCPPDAHTFQISVDAIESSGSVEIVDQNKQVLEVIRFSELKAMLVEHQRYVVLDRTLPQNVSQIAVRPANDESMAIIGDLSVLGCRSLGARDVRSPLILDRQHLSDSKSHN
jgi:hypothetical protein